MLSHFLSQVARFITDTIDAMGYGGIFLLMGISSSGIPLPSEVILPFSGALAGKGRFSLLGIALFGAFGSLGGTFVLYLIGKNFGRAFFIRYGKYLFVSHREISLAESFFRKYGWLAVFLGQLLPLIRTYIAFPAGMGKLNLAVVAGTSFSGSFIWSFSLASIGFKLGENWQRIEPFFREFDYLVLATILLLLLFAIWLRLKGKKNEER
ncbi:DedA family protein [bacterium]|nr:DedA family protein [bacterium]